MKHLLRRAGAAVDSLWSAFSQDDPLFCDCWGSHYCADCSLTTPAGAGDRAEWGTVGAQPIAAR